MFLPWLKQYMPRSLYGRAALILVLPVVVVTAIVSVAFIQRHLEDVTTQMTQTVVRELRLLQQATDGATTPNAALEAADQIARTLQVQLRFVGQEAVPEQDARVFYDYSGVILTGQLYATFPRPLSVQLPIDPRVELFFDCDLGPLAI